mgnify:CR=1 FL=1
MGFKVIYTFPTRQQGMDMVREVATVKVLREQYPPPTPITEGELLEEIADADAIVNVRSVLINRKIIEAAKNLKIIARHGLGYETIDVEAASERNIVVTRATAQGPYPVAEYAIGLLLALSKKYIPAHASVKSGKWESLKFMGSEARAKTLGIIGLGAIGSTVAQIARLGLGMRVIAYDPYVSEARATELGVKLVDLPNLLAEADYISIHAAVTKESKGLLGKREFDLMKKGGWEALAEELGVPFLGRLPLHPEVAEACDEGVPFVYKYPNNPVSKKMMEIAERLEKEIL